MNFSRGMRDALEKYADISLPIEAVISIDGADVYDYCCFGVDEKDQLSDDRYMIFYNQTSSPAGEITLSPVGNGAKFTLKLASLPPSIQKLVFTASIDGDGKMGTIRQHRFTVSQNQQEKISMTLTGADFQSEKAIISVEMYRRNGWRISAVAKGFNGGLSALLAAYGGTEEQGSSEPVPTPPPAPVRSPAPQPMQPQPMRPTPSAPVRPSPAPQPPVRTTPAQPSTYPAQQNAASSARQNSSDSIFDSPQPVFPAPTGSYQTPTQSGSNPPDNVGFRATSYPTPTQAGAVAPPPGGYRTGYAAPSPDTSNPPANVGCTNPYCPAADQKEQTPAQPSADIGRKPAPDRTSSSFGAPSEQPASKPVSLRKTEEQLAGEIMGKISLSKDKVNLEKHVVSLSKCVVNLSKESGADLGSLRARVVVALDYSGSMVNLYMDGVVQNTINRLVPLGLNFDDNGTIDVYLFQTTYHKLEDLTLSNYDRYVDQVILPSGYKMGGTSYAPVLSAIIDGEMVTRKTGLFGHKTETVREPGLVNPTTPTFILFITDGETSDRDKTDQLLRSCCTSNVFIQFIGIGHDKFLYLSKMETNLERSCVNTGFTKMEDLEEVDDNELYTAVLSRFSKWLSR